MNINKLIEGQREELQAEVMDDYIFTATMGHLALDQKAHSEEMRGHFEKLWNWHKQSLIKFLDSEIEMLEKDKARVNGLTLRGELEHGYILFVEDQIKHLQDIKKQLTQNNG